MNRTFVVGLDGASWRLVEPWIAAGDLPNLAAIRESGTYATSRSCLPPVTFPNWKCYSSGKNPGRFGVYWWERIDLERETIEIVEGSDFRTAELWDYLNRAGFSTGVVNMPSTYPPRDIDGVMVAGGPDAVDGEHRSLSAGFTSPASLEERLVEEYGYSVHPTPLISSNRDRGAEVEEILRLLDRRIEVARDLFLERDLDFVHVTLFYLNVLHHFFWDETPTKRAWTLVDEKLGELRDLPETNLVVVSDHGSAPTEVEFYVNEWLARNGYQVRDRTVDQLFQTAGLTRENALTLAKKLGIVDVLDRAVPDRIQELVPQRAGLKRRRKMDAIVPGRTSALASGQGPIYVHPGLVDEKDVERLQSDLKKVTDSQGDPLFVDVHRADAVYDGPYIDSGPDLVLEQRPGVHVNDGIGGGVVQTQPDRWAAENTPTGIFAAAGPDVATAGDVGEIDILDVAPTILALYDVPTPEDVDGRVLDVLSDGHDVGTQPPIDLAKTGHAGDETAVEDRLTRLGYME